MDLSLKGKAAIVTGGASNIGRAISITLAAEGANVVIADMDEKQMERVVSTIEASGGKAVATKTDVTKYDEVEALVKELDIAPVQVLVIAQVSRIVDGKPKVMSLPSVICQDDKPATITIGQTGPTIAQWCREAALGAGRTLLMREAGSLQEAVRAAFELSMPGSVVIFSPGCASYDMFQNFAERGHRFKELIAAAMQIHRAVCIVWLAIFP